MKEFFLKNKWLILICGIIGIVAIGGISFGIYYIFEKEDEEITSPMPVALKESEDEEQEEIEKEINHEIYVEVKGAVQTPGVYKIEQDSIINDLISLCGGFKSTAYTDNINLSRKVTAEMVIYVYTKTAYNKLKSSLTPTTTTTKEDKSVAMDTTCTTSTYDISNCIDNAESIIIVGDNDTNFSSDNTPNDIPNSTTTLVNINTATLSELMTISGIGESKAQNIIAYREESGKFNSIEDIQNVSGIGITIYEKIKDFITV